VAEIEGREVLELAREGSLAAMRRLIAIVDDPDAPYAARETEKAQELAERERAG
jgi:hypothetical protein